MTTDPGLIRTIGYINWLARDAGSGSSLARRADRALRRLDQELDQETELLEEEAK